MAHPLDDTDLRILRALYDDGRISMRSLSETLHISRANAYARTERLREAGVIRAIRADIDPVAAGLGTSAYVTLNLNQPDWRHVRLRLQQLPGIVHVALVGGEFDAVLLVRAKDNASLSNLVLNEIQSIPGVVSTRTLLIFDELNASGALTFDWPVQAAPGFAGSRRVARKPPPSRGSSVSVPR